MIALSIAILAAAATAAFDYREVPPNALFPLPLAADPAPLPDGASNPAYLPLGATAYLSGSGSIPYSLTDLKASGVRAGWAGREIGVRGSWHMFGLGRQYVEHTAEASFGCQPIRFLSFGAAALYRRLCIDTVESSLTVNAADAGCGLRIAPFEWITLAFRMEHLVSLFRKKQRDLFYPTWSAGASISPLRGFSIHYNLLKTATGYVNCVSASATILKYLAVQVGYSREIMTTSAAISIIYRYVAVSYGLRYHQHLGFTHSIGLTLSIGELPVEPIHYGDPFAKLREKRSPRIDINACSIEEIAALPGIGAERAERIMRYRLTVGPVSRSALIRMGLTERELDRLLPLITGLAQEEQTSEKRRFDPAAYQAARKALFTRLIAIGMPPSSALTAAEMALAGDSRVFSFINGLQGITPDQKKKAAEVCRPSR